MLMRTCTRLPVLLVALILCTCTAFAQEVPDAEQGAAALAATMEGTGPLWLEAVREDPLDPDLEAFAARLAAREDIASAEARDNEVLAITADGIRFRFSATPPGILSSGSASALAPVRTIADAVTGEPRCLGDQVPKGRALVIHGHHGGHEDVRSAFRAVLKEAGYTVETRRGVLGDFEDMSDAAIVVINAHGGVDPLNGGGHYHIESDYMEDLPAPVLQEWYMWLKYGELGIYHRIEWDDSQTPRVPKRSWWGVDIYDTWLENNLESMVPNALVLLLTCHGADLQTPWTVFKDKGAGAFLGFTGTVNEDFSTKWGLNFLKYILGTSTDRPSETAPYHRAWSLRDAFDRIKNKPGFARGYDYASDPDYQGKGYRQSEPVMRKFWTEPDSFSAAPHIDSAMIGRAENGTDYVVDLWGGFGLAEECTVMVGDRQVRCESVAGGGGMPLKVTVPPDLTGDLVVTDAWGRRSNPVTISEFATEVTIDYEDMMSAGEITLNYRELVTGSRLYMGLTDELIYAGLPAYRFEEFLTSDPQPHGLPVAEMLEQSVDIREMGYALVSGCGDWDLTWHFDSRKNFGGLVVRTTGDGAVSGQGTDSGGDDEPSVSFAVMLDPSHDDVAATTCDARVLVSTRVPVEITIEGGFGGVPMPSPAVMLGDTTVTYRQAEGALPAIDHQGTNARWTMPEVHLSPEPCGFSKRH
ncbi:MAG: hypothetical protein R6V07_12135 [Armatimonadota bacterium]